MKVKIQNGNVLDRSELIDFLKSVPASWTRECEKVVVFESAGAKVVSSFQRNEKLFGIHIPKRFSGSIDRIFDEVAITLQAVRDYGHIPKDVPNDKVKEYWKAWKEVSIEKTEVEEATE